MADTFERNGQVLRIVKPGDIVQLRSGGSEMVVTAVSGPETAQMITARAQGRKPIGPSPANFFVFLRAKGEAAE